MSSQISAQISEETRRLLNEYADAHGLKKGFLIEAALLHHLQALRELPSNVIIPPRLIVSRDSMERIADLTEAPPAPTAAMRALFGDDAG